MDGFDQWAFMTTHSWDEPSAGVWRLEVRNGQSACESTFVCRDIDTLPVIIDDLYAASF